jgi:hypothetical protein
LSATEETSADPDLVADDEDEADVPAEFDPNIEVADIDACDVETEEGPLFQSTRPIPSPAAKATTAAPRSALFRSGWERRKYGGVGGAIHLGT